MNGSLTAHPSFRNHLLLSGLLSAAVLLVAVGGGLFVPQMIRMADPHPHQVSL